MVATLQLKTAFMVFFQLMKKRSEVTTLHVENHSQTPALIVNFGC